jgi:hypothetical protein
MSASVADELFFEGWLDSLAPMDRAAVDRVLTNGGYGSRVSQSDHRASVSAARSEGYDRGLAAGRAEAKQNPAA